MSDALTRLIGGYKDFHRDYVGRGNAPYRESAARGQKPRIMFIACSDARVNPSLVTQASLGEIFLVCNVANLVPPYRPGKGTHHSTSAALEFAVNTLGVEHVIVMGHSNCGGIHALLDAPPYTAGGHYSFIKSWVEIIADARAAVSHLPQEERYHACEFQALKISLRNLATFPWILQKIEQGALSIHAWHFDIPTGVLNAYDPARDRFDPL